MMLLIIIGTVLFVLVTTPIQTLADEICVEGFVMDSFCLKLGVLMDQPSIKSLQNPEKHSVHCLVDVGLCLTSGYNILAPNPSGNPKYMNAYKLDGVGNQKVVQIARSIGDCATCAGSKQIKNGLRLTVLGKNISSSNGVTTLRVSKVVQSPKMYGELGDGCSMILEPITSQPPTTVSSTTDPTSTTTPKNPDTTTTVESTATASVPTTTTTTTTLITTIKPANRRICVEGFVMDSFCLKLGVLMDQPSIKSLQNPEKHSVHCLVDVGLCLTSGYNILAPNPSGNPKYMNAYKLDGVGNQKAIQIARSVGDCRTCTGLNSTPLKSGLRLTVLGIVSEGSNILKVEKMKASPFTSNNNSSTNGCSPGFVTVTPVATTQVTTTTNNATSSTTDATTNPTDATTSSITEKDTTTLTTTTTTTTTEPFTNPSTEATSSLTPKHPTTAVVNTTITTKLMTTTKTTAQSTFQDTTTVSTTIDTSPSTPISTTQGAGTTKKPTTPSPVTTNKVEETTTTPRETVANPKATSTTQGTSISTRTEATTTSRSKYTTKQQDTTRFTATSQITTTAQTTISNQPHNTKRISTTTTSTSINTTDNENIYNNSTTTTTRQPNINAKKGISSASYSRIDDCCCLMTMLVTVIVIMKTFYL